MKSNPPPATRGQESSGALSFVERAARAHYEASHDLRVELPWEACHPSYRAQKVGAMRAAIEAMLEPTEGMEDAGIGVVTRLQAQHGPPEGTAIHCYKAMIDAALSDPAGTVDEGRG